MAVLLFIVLSPRLLKAQSLRFENYSTRQGLVSDEVYNIYEDKLGYIWIFSNLGTVKYNSSGFVPVLKNLPFKESFIYRMYENANGQKWIANSKAKLFSIRNDSAFVIPGTAAFSDSIAKSGHEILQLNLDDSLNIYVVTKWHSYKLKKNKDGYSCINLSNQVKNDSVIVQCKKTKGIFMSVINRPSRDIHNLFHITSKYIQFDYPEGKTFARFNFKSDFCPLNFSEFGNDIYFSIVNGKSNLVRIRNKHNVFHFPISSMILKIARDEKGHLWIGTLNDGLYEINKNDSIVSHYFKGITVNDVLFDSQNGIWVSTSGSGLFHCENMSIHYFEQNHPLGTPIAFVKKLGGRVVVANKEGDVFFIKNRRQQLVCKNDTFHEPLDVIFSDSDYLVSFFYGIKKIHTSKNNRISITVPLIGAVHRTHQIIKAKDDSIIYRNKKGLRFVVKAEIRKSLVFDHTVLSCITKGDTFFLGTEDGVFLYGPKIAPDPKIRPDEHPYVYETLHRPPYLDKTKNCIVKKIVEDDAGNFWFCTQGSGLFKWSKRRFLSQVSEKENLPGNIINSVFLNSDNAVLLSTNMGLFFTGKSRFVYSETDWTILYEGEVKEAVVFENKVYAATNAGLIMIDYSSVKARKKMYFHLNAVTVNSKEISPINLTHLTYKQNSLEFTFDIIRFGEITREIEYSLNGPLRYSGKSKTISFQQLPPGSYTLTAYPNIKEGKSLFLSIPFNIKPAFWQTNLFIILLRLAGLAFIFFLVWLIIKRKEKKTAIKNKNEKLILEYKLIALKAQINPHFMSNCLSSIQDLIMSDQSEKATFYVSQFGLMVRKILDFSSKHIITLAEELELLTVYMELEQLRFENKFSFVIKVEDDISLQKIFLPPLILNPLVENAIWHGLLPLQNSKKGELQISVSAENSQLVLSVKDNGVGWNTEKKMSTRHKSGAYGIKITEQRLMNINNFYGGNRVKMTREDLKDENMKSSGTQITLYLPLDLNPRDHEEN